MHYSLLYTCKLAVYKGSCKNIIKFKETEKRNQPEEKIFIKRNNRNIKTLHPAIFCNPSYIIKLPSYISACPSKPIICRVKSDLNDTWVCKTDGMSILGNLRKP